MTTPPPPNRRARVVEVRVLLDAATDADAADMMSALLSQTPGTGVIDWRHTPAYLDREADTCSRAVCVDGAPRDEDGSLVPDDPLRDSAAKLQKQVQNILTIIMECEGDYTRLAEGVAESAPELEAAIAHAGGMTFPTLIHAAIARGGGVAVARTAPDRWLVGASHANGAGWQSPHAHPTRRAAVQAGLDHLGDVGATVIDCDAVVGGYHIRREA